MATEEYYYDSLEEDDNEDIKFRKYTENINSNELSKTEIKPKVVTVPLYGGEVRKDDLIKLLKNKQKSTICANFDNFTSCLACLKSKKSEELHAKKLNSDGCLKSVKKYSGEEIGRNSRDSVCSSLNYETPGSFASYKTYFGIESKNSKDKHFKQKCHKNNCGRSMFDNNSSIFSKSVVSTVDLENLRSVSEFIPPTYEVKPAKVKYNSSILKAPVLGSLGPDLVACKEKMERLKKQQDYGRYVSIQNRVKVIQSYMKSRQNIMNKNAKQNYMNDFT